MDRGKVRERGRKVLVENYIKVVEVVLDVPAQNGAMMENISRELVYRSDAAAALVHDIDRDVFIFAEQFRFPAYERGGGWLLELVAGHIDAGEAPDVCIIREIAEEVGYRAGAVEARGWFYSATAYSTEQIHLFYAPVHTTDFTNPGASGTDHGEDIRRVELTRAEFLVRLKAGDFQDPKILSLGAWALDKFG
jgi:ADP-ribose pyrophosphatase